MYFDKTGPGQAPGLFSQYPVWREGIRPNDPVFLLVANWEKRHHVRIGVSGRSLDGAVQYLK